LNVAINQPYLFPHIKYFQLLNHSELFIIYDDVQYIKKSWINKNRLNNHLDEKKITIPIRKQERNTLIKDTRISEEHFSESINNIQKSIQKMYKNSEEKDFILNLLEESLLIESDYLDKYIIFYLEEICKFLDLNFNIKRSSSLEYIKKETAEESIISIVKKVGGDVYLNLDGGISLYDKNIFLQNNIELEFISNLYSDNSKINNNYSVISHLLVDGRKITAEYIRS
tara:strand:+ start:170 stop:850 length:681 start_codon:yes stop_codon:yes gene_type:complete